MKTVLIAAVSPDRVIGRGGAVPWHYPSDMRHFRETTTGHPCVMGRKTWESLPRRPLPGRPNLVLTRRASYEAAAGATVCASFEEARRRCAAMGADKMFVLGGEEVFREAMPAADEMLITHVPDQVTGDVHFPEWDEGEWTLAEEKDEESIAFIPPVEEAVLSMVQIQVMEGLRFARYVRRRDR